MTQLPKNKGSPLPLGWEINPRSPTGGPAHLATSCGTNRALSSRQSGFFRLPLDQRRAALQKLRGLSGDAMNHLAEGGLDLEAADRMVENVVGRFSLPFGIATNFTIDGEDALIPMVIEEPSVIAAASNAAKMVRAGGGFATRVTDQIMIGQVELLDVTDADAAISAIESEQESILKESRELVPGLVSRGGGPVGLEVRQLTPLPDDRHTSLAVHLLVDVCDAMGANMVNTIAEAVSARLAAMAGARAGLRILSNLCVQRLVHVTARVPDEALAKEANGNVRSLVIEASKFAERDPYRAATHNKGIMNGVDAVLLATANDWRGVQAGAHAYAARSGIYRPLAVWTETDGTLVGEMELPMAAGTVGGAINGHPCAQVALDILGTRSAKRLASCIGAAGLASNLAALRALATDGIQGRTHAAPRAQAIRVVPAAEGPRSKVAKR